MLVWNRAFVSEDVLIYGDGFVRDVNMVMV